MDHNLLNYYGTDYIAAICAIIGIFFIGNKNRFGFVLYMIATAFGIIFGYLAKTFPLMVMNSILFVMNLRAFLKWKK